MAEIKTSKSEETKRTQTSTKSTSTSSSPASSGAGNGISYGPGPAIAEPSAAPAESQPTSSQGSPQTSGAPTEQPQTEAGGGPNLPGEKSNQPDTSKKPDEKPEDKKEPKDEKDKDQKDKGEPKEGEPKDEGEKDLNAPTTTTPEETETPKPTPASPAIAEPNAANAAKAGVKAGATVGEKLAEDEVAADATAAGAAATGVGAPVAGAIEVGKYVKQAYDIGSILWDNKYVRYGVGIAAAIPILITLTLVMGIFGWFMGFGPGGSANKETAMVSAQVEPFARATGLPPQVSRDAISDQDLNQATTRLIADSTNVSPKFQSFAADIASQEDELDQLANKKIIKADTSEEMIPLLEKIKALNDKITSYNPPQTTSTSYLSPIYQLLTKAKTADSSVFDSTKDDENFYNYLKSYYLAEESNWLSLADFNEMFEYLLLQTGQGAEINGQKVDDKALRTSRQANAPKMMDMVASREKEFIQSSPSSADDKAAQIKAIDDHVQTVNSDMSEETKPRDDKIPPALEFADPQELAVLLPQTKADFTNYNAKNIQPDVKIYYLLSYIFHVWEQTGEDYANYKKDNVIQQATTPSQLLLMCGDKLENDPKICPNPPVPACGIPQLAYSLSWLDQDNIGVPYKDRGHLKIWLGLNAPYYSDEKNQADKKDPNSLNVVNTHYDLRAMDISEIGLYNERLDCAGCRGLQKCPENCTLLPTPIPCCPLLLDSAKDAYVPVQVQWAHNNFADNLLGAATDVLSNNATNLTGTIGDLVSNPLSSLFGNLNLGNLDFYQLMNGDFTSIMSNIGHGLTNDLFSRLGLPGGFDPLNPNFDSLVSNLGSNYLNQAFNLPGGSFTPILSSLMSGNYKDVALDMLNRSVDQIDLPPTISNLISTSINSGNPTQSALYSLANTGLQQLNNNTFSWPSDVLDLSNLAGTGFNGITNRLGENIFNKITSLPTATLFSPQNPQATFLSSSAGILSEQTNNQSIANNVNQQISANQTPTLYSTLKSLSKDDLKNLLALPADKITKLYDYLQNPDAYPSGHSAFLNDFTSDLDYAKLAAGNSNLNEYAIKTIIEKGTSPTLGNEYTLSAITAESILDKIGATYSEEDAAKLPYALDLIAAENNNDNNKINDINQKYQQTFTQSSESLANYRTRLITVINNAGKAQTYINYYQSSTKPLKLTFANSSDFYLLANNQANLDYQDTTHLTDPATSQDITLTDVLHQQKIDLRSLVYVPQADFENQTVTDSNHTTVTLAPDTVYYAYPQIDLAEVIIPGINPDKSYHNNVGAFKLLETTTYILHQSVKQPAVISISRPDVLSHPTTDSYATAFKNKYLLSIKNSDGSTQTVDYLAHLGGTNYVYQTLTNLGQDSTASAQNLANMGTLTTAYDLTGIDISNPSKLNLNENQVKDLINTMGVVNSWTTGNFTSGQTNILNFVKDNNVFNNIALQNSDINFSNVFSSISSGNVYQFLNNIPLFQSNYQSVASKFGNIPIDQFYNNFIANPSPENILSSTKSIMANYMSNNSGIDQVTALQEITNTLGNDPKNFPKLLSNSYFQSTVFKDVSPALLNDMTNIYGNIASGNLDLNTGLSLISTGGLIDRLAGPSAYSDLVGQYGGTIMNAVQNMSPQNIANLAFNQFSDQINNFLTNNGLSSIFPNGLGQLFSGNIDQFVTGTVLNYLQNNLLNNLPANLQGPLFNNLQNLLNGNLSLSSLTQMVIPQLTSLLPNINLNLTNPFSDLTSGLSSVNGLAGNVINGVIGSALNHIFEPCKSKIASDNMIHLTDIILSFDRNRRTQYYYDITSSADGQLLPEDQPNISLILPKFYWHQMFSDYPKKVFDKIAKKATEKLNAIWPRDENGSSDINVKNDVWKNDCTNRDNQFLTKCQDYIHINF